MIKTYINNIYLLRLGSIFRYNIYIQKIVSKSIVKYY